jgi:hypothetical protein
MWVFWVGFIFSSAFLPSSMISRQIGCHLTEEFSGRAPVETGVMVVLVASVD